MPLLSCGNIGSRYKEAPNPGSGNVGHVDAGNSGKSRWEIASSIWTLWFWWVISIPRTPSESNHPSCLPVGYLGKKSHRRGFQRAFESILCSLSFTVRNWRPGRSFLPKASYPNPGQSCLSWISLWPAGIGWCPPPTTIQGHWVWQERKAQGTPLLPADLEGERRGARGAASPHLVPGIQSSGQHCDIDGSYRTCPGGFLSTFRIWDF